MQITGECKAMRPTIRTDSKEINSIAHDCYISFFLQFTVKIILKDDEQNNLNIYIYIYILLTREHLFFLIQVIIK